MPAGKRARAWRHYRRPWRRRFEEKGRRERINGGRTGHLADTGNVTCYKRSQELREFTRPKMEIPMSNDSIPLILYSVAALLLGLLALMHWRDQRESQRENKDTSRNTMPMRPSRRIRAPSAGRRAKAATAYR